MTARDEARKIFLDTLGRLDVAEAIRSGVECRGGVLRVGDLKYELREFERVVVVALGKAAGPMCDALLGVLQPALAGGLVVDGIVVGATRHRMGAARVRWFAGSHPFPDEGSREAADAVLELLEGCDARCLVLFLISGGASAMMEKPIDPEMTVEDVAEFYRALVLSGLPIAKMNALRGHFSQVKGGRLARAAWPATQCTLLVSDVPEKMLYVVGSGPSLADASTVEDCREIIAEHGAALHLPEKVAAYFGDAGLAETPKADEPEFARSAWMAVLSSDDLCRVAGDEARRLGYHVVVDNGCDDWEYREAAAYLVGRLRALREEHEKVCVISAGEVLVQVTRGGGRGGRNQQFALECARLLADGGLQATVLSGGSDGGDGNSPAAGAVADETTMARAAELGLDGAAALERFDAYAVFEALGDAIVTGPTGNNVRDLRMLLSG